MPVTLYCAAAVTLCFGFAALAVLLRLSSARRLRRLKSQQALLITLVSAFPESYCLIDRDGVILDGIPEDAPWVGKPFFLTGKKSIFEIVEPYDSTIVLDGLRDCLDRNRLVDLRCSMVFPDGLRSYECRFVSFEQNAAVCFFRDVTAAYRHESDLAKTLADRELLLREINHRVNNNLQIISSFLHMQAEQFSNDEDREIAYDGLRRVQLLATMHELIYRAENVSFVALGPFLGELVSSLAFALHCDPSLVRVQVKDLSVSINRAFPLGMIVGEFSAIVIKSLVSAGAAEGRSATVSFYPMGDSIVLDFDCVGVSPFTDQNLFDRGVMSCLLVPPLARELGGTLRCDSGENCSIIFPSYIFLHSIEGD